MEEKNDKEETIQEMLANLKAQIDTYLEEWRELRIRTEPEGDTSQDESRLRVTEPEKLRRDEG